MPSLTTMNCSNDDELAAAMASNLGLGRARRQETAGGGIDRKVAADGENADCAAVSSARGRAWGDLHPPPKIFSVDFDDGPLVVVATERSAALIPVHGYKGKTRYFLRWSDGCFEAEDYLVADLKLGRRERPELGVEIVHENLTLLQDHPTALFATARVDLQLRIENWGFRPASEVRIGIVSPDLNGKPLLGHLRANFDSEWKSFKHETGGPKSRTIECFDGWTFGTHFAVPREQIWPDLVSHVGTLSAATYLVAESLPPTWYQVTAVIRPTVRGLRVELSRLAGSRPKVALELKPEI